MWTFLYIQTWTWAHPHTKPEFLAHLAASTVSKTFGYRYIVFSDFSLFFRYFRTCRFCCSDFFCIKISFAPHQLPFPRLHHDVHHVSNASCRMTDGISAFPSSSSRLGGWRHRGPLKWSSNLRCKVEKGRRIEIWLSLRKLEINVAHEVLTQQACNDLAHSKEDLSGLL